MMNVNSHDYFLSSSPHPHPHPRTHVRQSNTSTRPSTSPTSTQSRSTATPLSRFDSYTYKTPTTQNLRGRGRSPSTSSSSDEEEEDDDLEEDEGEDEDESSASSEYNEEDHRRLLFAMSRGGMNPQLELALRLMKGTGEDSDESGEDEDGDDVKEVVEEVVDDEEDLDSVEEDFHGYSGFPITSPSPPRPYQLPTTTPTKSTPRSSGEFSLPRSHTTSPSPVPTNPYAAYGPEPGVGKVRRWLEGVQVSEMVA